MALVESEVVALELERVIPKVRVLFERDDKFFSTIEKRDVEKVSNRQMRIPLEIRPGGYFAYFNPDGGPMGRGGAPSFDKAVISAAFMLEAIEYTKLAQWATDDERKAIVNSVRRLTATALDEMRRQIDSQLMQGGTGVIGTISAVSTSTGVDTYTLGTDGFGARLMRYGQPVQVFDSSYVLRGSGVITGWDVAGKKVKVTPSIASSAATDYLVTAGITDPTAGQALYGVPYHHDVSSMTYWLGFTKANYPEICSNSVNAASAALTLAQPRLVVNKIGNRVGIDENTKLVAWMHPCQEAAYEEQGQLVMLIQKQAKDEALNMYFGGAKQLAGCSVKTSYNWDKTRIDFVNQDVWGRGEILPIGFYTTDGRKYFELRGPDGGLMAADIFYMVCGFNTFVSNPAATGYIYGLAVPSGY